MVARTNDKQPAAAKAANRRGGMAPANTSRVQATNNFAASGWRLCPACDCGITDTDLEAGECTSCGQAV